MYKRLVTGLLLLAGLVGIAAPVQAASVQDFTITSFTGDYYLYRQSDGVAEMRVREQIVAEFPDYDQNHGILRAIPQTYEGHGLELTITGVHKENAEAWQYETYRENGNTVLKIGDPDAYAHGEQTYFIDYTVRGPVQVGEGRQRLFWDINGDQWPQTFGEVTARVRMPSDIAAGVTAEPICYTGRFGSEASDCTVSVARDGTETAYTVKTTRGLGAKETLSVAVPFAAGTFKPYTLSAGELWRWVGIGTLIAVPPIIALIIVVRRWRSHGRDAKGRGVVVPQYVPPKGVSVLGSSAVLHQGFRVNAVSATIIDLAVRHHLKIFETGKKMFGGYKYDIEIVKTPRGLLPEEEQVVAMLFDSPTPAAGTRISLESLSKTVYQKAAKIGETADTLMTAQGYFVQNPTKARLPFLVAGGVLTVLGFMVMPHTLGLVLAGVVMLIGGAVMAAPTRKGAELKEYLLGLKMYMQLAEAERLKVLQSPHGSLTEKIDVGDKGQLVKLYERLLPYAVLFGIEKDWAKQFAGLYERQPEWYSGSGTFNAVYFAGAVSGLDTKMTQSFSPPSSSGSGAGGGGGGGGGGGW